MKMFQTPSHSDLSDYITDTAARDMQALCKPIQFNPTYYDYNVKYSRKSRLLYVDSSEHLPRLLLNDKAALKARLHAQQLQNKKAYGITNQVLNKGTIYFDGLSYDAEAGYQSKIENEELYGSLIHFLNGEHSPTLLFQSLLDHSTSHATVYQHNSLDLLYLNLFRVTLYIETSQTNGFKITSYLYYPQLGFELCEIRQPNKLVETPLTRLITRQSEKKRSDESKSGKPQYKFGFLTLDQSKRILPLMASDPIVFELPLIGSWFYSNDPNEEVINKTNLIWTMIAEFVIAQRVKSKITSSETEKSFLFVIFQKYRNPIFFDVKVLKQSKNNSWRMLKQVDFVHEEQLGQHIISFNHAQSAKINQSSDLLRTSVKKVSGKKRCQTQMSPHILKSPDWADTHQKIPPKPLPLFNDTSSLSSATFKDKTNHSHISSGQISDASILQHHSEQVKQLQNQIEDLSRIIRMQQMQQSYQFFYPMQQMPLPPPQMSPYMQAPPPQYMYQPQPPLPPQFQNQYYSPFYPKHSDPQHHFSKVNINAFPQMSSRSTLNSDSSGKQQVAQKSSPQLINQTFQALPQKLDFLNDKIKSLKKTAEGEIEDMVNTLVSEEKKSSSPKQSISQLIKLNHSLKQSTIETKPLNSPAQKDVEVKISSQKKEPADVKNFETAPPKEEIKSEPVANKLASPKVILKTEGQSNKKSSQKKHITFKKESPTHLLKSLKKMNLTSDNKENSYRYANNESAKSKIPKIRCILNNLDDSDSDDEIKKVQMKYLNWNKFK